MTSRLDHRLEEIVRAAPSLMAALGQSRAFDLPDWMIVSGAVYQRVWNHLTGRDPDHGVRDYDLVYFDASDLSYEAEDVEIQRARHHFQPPLDQLVEVRNQARVHLWFEDHFGQPFSPLASTAEALERFVAPAFSIGIRLEADDSLSLFAPFGLDDLFDMALKPTPGRPLARDWDRIIASVQARWPEVSVRNPP